MGEDKKVFVEPKCNQIKKKPNHAKTWCQPRAFHQFRGELPGYCLNAPGLYNESLKTFSLRIPLSRSFRHTDQRVQHTHHL